MIGKLKDAIWWVRHRTVNKYHLVDTGLEPGYYDKDTLMFQACFKLLEDYVEVELAWMQCICSKEDAKKYGMPNEFSRMFGAGRKWRCPEAGLAHLDWEMNLEPDKWGNVHTSQIESAKEQLELYNWWKARPNRPDPYEDYFTNKEKANKVWDTEQAYEKEDDEMLARLLKIRRTLWT